MICYKLVLYFFIHDYYFSIVSPSVQSHLTITPENEPLSTENTLQKDINNEQNYSVFSFPEHDSSPSQESDNQLVLDANAIVDESMRNAQEEYTKVFINYN